MLETSEILQEYVRRKEHVFYRYTPTDTEGHNQKAFHQSNKAYRLLLGGNQSGKSMAAAQEIAWWVTGRHPYRKTPTLPVDVWSISAEYETIRNGIFRHLVEIIPDWEIQSYGPKIPNTVLPQNITLKNGSTIVFKSAKGDSREKFQAAAIHLISIDEEVAEDIFEELEARTLATGGQFIISATPLHSFDWILELERKGEQGDPNIFLTRLNTLLNPYINKERLELLSKKWSRELQVTRIYGKSAKTVGLIYRNWNPRKHEVSPFTIPKHWPRWCAIDPGFRTFAALWIAVDENNAAYAYRELYAHGEPLWRVAMEIKKLERWRFEKELSQRYKHFVWEETDDSEHMVQRIIDDKRGSRLITGEEGVLEQLYSKYGISAVPADKSKRAGIEDVRLWLERDPCFSCFTTLQNFLDERRVYRIRPGKTKRNMNAPIDEPINKNNHLMDCWRYLARVSPRYSDKLNWDSQSSKSAFDRIRDRKTREKEEGLYHEYLGSEW